RGRRSCRARRRYRGSADHDGCRPHRRHSRAARLQVPARARRKPRGRDGEGIDQARAGHGRATPGPDAAMNLRPRPKEEPELNLTSLIDVVLLLLIFFMVSTTFIDESRIKILLPQAGAEPAPEQRRDPIEIAVTASGEFRVDGKTLLNPSPTTLSAAVTQIAGQRRDLPITIRADARAT